MLPKLIDYIRTIQAVLEHTKPLLFEIVLFLWAAIEMAKFIWTVALGGHTG
jgi:hypothetical protein